MRYLELFMAMFFISCFFNTQHYLDLENTKWIYDYGGGYVSYYIFKEGKYEFYDAEMGETIFGTYLIKNDTICINQFAGIYDEEFSKKSRHRIQKKHFEFVLKNGNEMGFIENWDNDKQAWIENFYFKKIN